MVTATRAWPGLACAVRRIVAAVGLVGLSAGSAQADEWADVCWSPHADYFKERGEYLKLTYSRLNVNAVRATYLVGKPAYALISNIDDAGFDVVTGLGGGPWGVVRSVIYGQGMDAGLALLRTYLETPQDLATEVGGRTMEKGIAALNRNYRRFRRGVSALDNAAMLEFRQDQVYVDLMGPAKKLYLAAKGDNSTAVVDPDVLESLSAAESTFAGTALAGRMETVVEFLDGLRQSGVDLDSYAPYRAYQASVDAVREANGIIACAEDEPPGADRTEVAATAPGTGELPDAYIAMTTCEGGSIIACRRYCYDFCDHDDDGSIRGGKPEGTCYADCNDDCDRLCLPADAQPEREAPQVKAYVGGSLRLSAVFSARTRAVLDEAGLLVVLPDGTQSSCMDGVLDQTHGCGGRRWSPNGFAENRILIRGFRAVGRYRIYFDASRSSSGATLHVANGLVERWARTASFDGYRGAGLEFEERTVAAGEAVLLATIVVVEE